MLINASSMRSLSTNLPQPAIYMMLVLFTAHWTALGLANPKDQLVERCPCSALKGELSHRLSNNSASG
jgi:hypothetical protein